MKTRRQLERLKRLQALPEQERAVFAETLRERIYSTLTLLAVLVVLWQHAETHSPLGVIGSIVGTVMALWLATIIAAKMSYRIMHSESELAPKYSEVSTSASGLLMPAIAPTLLVLLSYTPLINLQTALVMGILSLLLSLFFFSLYAGRKSSDSVGKILLYSALQMALGVGVVLLKLAVE